jgi:hypothetical protein
MGRHRLNSEQRYAAKEKARIKKQESQRQRRARQKARDEKYNSVTTEPESSASQQTKYPPSAISHSLPQGIPSIPPQPVQPAPPFSSEFAPQSAPQSAPEPALSPIPSPIPQTISPPKISHHPTTSYNHSFRYDPRNDYSWADGSDNENDSNESDDDDEEEEVVFGINEEENVIKTNEEDGGGGKGKAADYEAGQQNTQSRGGTSQHASQYASTSNLLHTGFIQQLLVGNPSAEDADLTLNAINFIFNEADKSGLQGVGGELEQLRISPAEGLDEGEAGGLEEMEGMDMEQEDVGDEDKVPEEEEVQLVEGEEEQQSEEEETEAEEEETPAEEDIIRLDTEEANQLIQPENFAKILINSANWICSCAKGKA